MTELQGTSSSWILDLTAFLKSVFLSFTNLPLKLAQMTCMSACQHLARCIMSMLMNENVKAITIELLQQLDLDLIQCEQFAGSEPIQGLEVSHSMFEGTRLKCVLHLGSITKYSN